MKRLILQLGLIAAGLLALCLGGCKGPEEGRARGGGAGGDGGNYERKPIHAPSKIDGTKTVPDPFS
jgi:hypothetical protein